MEKKLTAEEIAMYHEKEIPCIPASGIKHFEPNGSSEELLTIENHLKAVGELISFQRVQKLGSLSEAIWHPDLQKAEVTHHVGSCWSSMGHVIDKKLYLYPEEALYLLEMGMLELKYNGIPISIQSAYSALLNPQTDISEECYRVYSQLNANGYKVVRHKQSNVLTKYEKQLQIHKAGIKSKMGNVAIKRDMPSSELEGPSVDLKKRKSESLTEKFPVHVTGDNELDLKDLQIFKSYENSAASTLQVKYDVYLSSDGKSSFKKSCLQLPKVRVVVHRSCDPMPALKEIYHLAQQFQDEVPVIHAIVFPDSVSFYNLTPVRTPVCE